MRKVYPIKLSDILGLTSHICGICRKRYSYDPKEDECGMSDKRGMILDGDRACSFYEKVKDMIEFPGMYVERSRLLFEQIDWDGVPRFAVWTSEKEVKLEAVLSRENGYVEKGYIKPVDRLLWELAGKPLDYESEKDLWEEVRQFIWDHWDYYDERAYDVFTGVVFASYTLERWFTISYLQFLGPRDSGKTRGLDILRLLAYRSVMSASISTAALYRFIETFHPFVLLDETEQYGLEEKADIRAILNAGYKRGQYALRMRQTAEGSHEYDYFDVFGFKALAGTEGFIDTLESRCILFTMEKAARPIEDIAQSFLRARELRSKLLMYRFRTLTEKD